MKKLRIAAVLTAAALLPSCSGNGPATTGAGTARQIPVGPGDTVGTADRAQPIPPRPVQAPRSAPETMPAGEIGIADRADVRGFIGEMSQRHRFDPAELQRVFDEVALQPAILEAMKKPYEAKPWHAYRKLFLTEKRITGGREFQARNAEALARAERRYGVAPEIVTAIIGIESSYGQKPGKYRVIDSLSTLAFEYPRRAEFFRKELAEFLLLCREEGMDPLQPLGSYAGAMGMPQFMPSSYRKLAADGDGDGRRDIWNNPADAIASVARYFAASGWRTGQPIASPARINGTAPTSLVSRNWKPAHTLGELSAAGIEPDEPVPDGLKASVIRLDEEFGPGYWLGFQNFYVITRYNHSPLYAMAAYELSRELAPERAARVQP